MTFLGAGGRQFESGHPDRKKKKKTSHESGRFFLFCSSTAQSPQAEFFIPTIFYTEGLSRFADLENLTSSRPLHQPAF